MKKLLKNVGERVCKGRVGGWGGDDGVYGRQIQGKERIWGLFLGFGQ